MKMNWSKPLSEGLKFGFHPKRWFQIFIIDAIFLSIILSAIYFNISNITYIVSSLRTVADRFLILTLLNYILIPAAIFIIWFLVRIWINGSIIYQSWKTKDSEIRNSWGYSCKKYPSLFLAILIISLLSILFSIIPYIGWFLVIIISWIFYFALQSIIIKKKGFYEGLSDSYGIFTKNPLEVIVIWLVITILSGVIVGIFAVPLISILFLNIFYLIQTAGISSVILLFKEQIVLLTISGLIFLIGTSITTAFSMKAQVEFYLQFKKRFRIF